MPIVEKLYLEKESSEPLFVYTGTLAALTRLLELVIFIFSFLLLISFLADLAGINLLGFALLSGLCITVPSIAILIALPFARDFEFHEVFLKIRTLTQTRIVPYWEVQYCVLSANVTADMHESNQSVKLKLRGSGVTFEIKGNPFNRKTGMHLYEFLRMRTAPRIVHTTIYS